MPKMKSHRGTTKQKKHLSKAAIVSNSDYKRIKDMLYSL